jgi:hypothetical protein
VFLSLIIGEIKEAAKAASRHGQCAARKAAASAKAWHRRPREFAGDGETNGGAGSY